MRGRLAAVALALAGASAAGGVTWRELTARPRPAGQQRIAYGADPRQFAELWLPAGSGPHRVVIMIHGGCWQSQVAGAGLMDWAAADLARRGLAVWNVEYRGVDVAGGGYPGTFLDVGTAADALRGQAARHRLRLDRVVAVGHSAGGHLALWLAARRGLPAGSPLRRGRPLAIAHAVSLGGLPDLAAARTEAAKPCGADTVDRLVDRPGVTGAARYTDTSLPPLVAKARQTLVNGVDDTVAPPIVAARYARATGATAIAVPGQGHFDEIAPGQPAWEAAVRAIMVAR